MIKQGRCGMIDSRREISYRLLRKSVLGILFMATIFPWTISIGDEEVSVSVVNKTKRYLHVLMNDTPFLYVSPEASVSYKSDGPTHVMIRVFYSPGQGVSGSASKSVNLRVGGGGSCHKDSKGSCHCSSEPEYGESIAWQVTPDLLTTTGL